jgi:hypothetical protein
MSFFYDLNKRLANLAAKQDQQIVTESKKVEAVARSPLTQALVESEKWIQKAVNPKTKGNLHKALHVPQGETIPKAKIAKATHSKNPKLRHMAQFAKNVAKEDTTDEGNEFSGNLAKAKAQHKDEFEVDGKKYKVVEADPTGLGESHCPKCDCSPCECVEEGNAFTGKLNSTPKGSKFKLGNKEFKDTSSIEEQEMDEGYAEMDAWLKSREKEKGTGKFDKKERILPGGMKATTYTRKPEPEDDDAEVTTITIKKKGRPAGTKRAIGAKHSGRSKLARKDAIAEEIPVTDRGEYDDEAGMAKDQIHTIVRHARELEQALGANDNLPEWVQEKMGQIKGMMTAVTDYMLSQKERGIEQSTGKEGITLEKAPPGAKAERMVKGIKKSLSKDGKLSDKDKAIAYATTWKAKKAGKVEEEGSKPDFLDVDKDGNKKETFKKAVADKKEEKVDETTTSGSVATAPATPKPSKGMQFGKGVYESLSTKLENMISEGMNVSVNMNSDAEGEAQKSITVTATGDDADKLAELLKMAGLEQKQETCSVCGEANCGCGDEMVDENSPDWPTKPEITGANDPYLRRWSKDPKSTGQTTVPVVASQLRRQVSMEENVELERTLFKTWKNYKG